ncbi:unnamed protein product [Onchocerca flexuosa]|uniref:Uncharacterized protein n=1 Tax=Onchocerca flexuosa TaxID=387005 RepID=A0A183GXZ1_9BILA|nr:unnamed protein product [Onchocerca flexuosa]
MSILYKTNNYKLSKTLSLRNQHHSDKNLESNGKYRCVLSHLPLIDWFFFSVNQQQRKSFDENRTFIITDPQHCSVSATVSLDRPKKFFINKGKITEKTTATATFQEPIAVRSDQQNLDDSKEVSTSTNNKIDQKSAVAKLRTESIAPSGNHHLQNSVNSNNDNIFSKILQQKCSNIVPYHSTPTDNVGTVSITKYSDSATTEIALDVPRLDSQHSTLNSRESGGYNGDCSSINSLHSTEYKDGMNRRQNNNNESRESLGSRLSRGFLEFTQGSSDRLQKWKNKLQNGRRHKDSSEPPPINRLVL